MDVIKIFGGIWTEFIWLGLGSDEMIFLIRCWYCDFHKRKGIFLTIRGNILTSQERLLSYLVTNNSGLVCL